MSKKKKTKNPQNRAIDKRLWFPDFSPQFKEDLGWWYKKDSSKVDKIFELISDTMKDPFNGLGKPEPLKHIDSDTWSRRINLEHRLVYRVSFDRVDFLQARYHY